MDETTLISQAESSPRTLLLIEHDEQKESLHHPIRKHIIRVLSAGINDFETEVTTEVQTLDDGTGLTHSVEVRRPIQRYWLTVPEIVEELENKYPELKITSHQCYYHLQKLEEQDLVEQDPPSEFDDDGRKKRTRGLQFRSVARFFIYHRPKFSTDSPYPCIDFLQNGWGIEPSEEDCKELTNLILEQDMVLFNALEKLVNQMNASAIDSVSFSVLLERLAHVLLSDNDEFIERYRDAKRILLRSGGEILWSVNTVEGKETRGKAND